MADLATPHVPVSWGELLDKLSILAIKHARLSDPQARANVENEQRQLAHIAEPVLARADMAVSIGALTQVNTALWDVEDALREHEAAARFDASFVALARSVYRLNDERAAIKRQVNDLLGSELVEEKSYAGVSGTPTER